MPFVNFQFVELNFIEVNVGTLQQADYKHVNACSDWSSQISVEEEYADVDVRSLVGKPMCGHTSQIPAEYRKRM